MRPLLRTASATIVLIAAVATIYVAVITYRNQPLAEEATKRATEQALIQTENIKSTSIPHFAVSKSTVTSKSGDKEVLLLTSDGGKIFDLTSEVVLDVETVYNEIRREVSDSGMARGHLFVKDYFTQRVDVLKNTVEVSIGDPKLLFKLRADVRNKCGGSTDYPRMVLTPICYIKIDCFDVNRHPFTQVLSFKVSFNSSAFGPYEKVEVKDYHKLSATYDHIYLDGLDAKRLLDDQRSGKGKPI